MTLLRILLILCHFIADFTPLSMPHMLKAKAKGAPIWPIIQHGFIHAFLMQWVLFMFLPVREATLLAFLQWVTHTGIDILKGRINVWHPPASNPANKIHWMIFGADQFLHLMVIEGMIYLSQIL